MPTSIEVLTQINLDDLVSSLGWRNQPLLARLLRQTLSANIELTKEEFKTLGEPS